MRGGVVNVCAEPVHDRYLCSRGESDRQVRKKGGAELGNEGGDGGGDVDTCESVS